MSGRRTGPYGIGAATCSLGQRCRRVEVLRCGEPAPVVASHLPFAEHVHDLDADEDDAGGVGAALIDRYGLRKTIALDGPSEKPLRRSLITFGRKEKVDGGARFVRRRPRGRQRTAWGRYDSLRLYRQRLSLGPAPDRRLTA